MSTMSTASFCSAAEDTKYAVQYKVRMMHYKLRSSVLRSVACTSSLSPSFWKPRATHLLGTGASWLRQHSSLSGILVFNAITKALSAVTAKALSAIAITLVAITKTISKATVAEALLVTQELARLLSSSKDSSSRPTCLEASSHD